MRPWRSLIRSRAARRAPILVLILALVAVPAAAQGPGNGPERATGPLSAVVAAWQSLVDLWTEVVEPVASPFTSAATEALDAESTESPEAPSAAACELECQEQQGSIDPDG